MRKKANAKLIGYATKVYGKEPLHLSSFQRRDTANFYSSTEICKNCIIGVAQTHSHSFCRRRLKYCGKHKNYFHPRREVFESASASLHFLFMRRCIKRGCDTLESDTSAVKNVFALGAEQILKIITQRRGHQTAAIANTDRCMSVVISNEKFPSEMCGAVACAPQRRRD